MEVLAATIKRHPLATLVTVGKSTGVSASHIPLLYSADSSLGILRGHMARANRQWSDYLSGSEALAIFAGPQHYISPAWYASKKEHGRVVPTWNYVVVHVHGTLTLRQDPEWLLENVEALTNSQERHMDTPWQVSDAPPEFVDGLVKAIVGIEFKISRAQGKWKLSQNRSDADRMGVIAALEASSSTDARAMASLIHASLSE